MRFKTKLIISFSTVILIPFLCIAFFLDRNLEKNSLKEIEASLVSQAQLIRNQMSEATLKQPGNASLHEFVSALKSVVTSRLTIINRKGQVLADSERSPQEIISMENHAKRPEIEAALQGGIGIDMRYSSTLKIDMLYVAVPIHDMNEVAGVLRLALPLASVQKTVMAIRKSVALGLLSALLLALALGSLVARRTLSPVNKMIRVARQFSEGDFSRRISIDSRDEIGELARTLNIMAQDIQDKIGQIQMQNQRLAAVFDSMIEGVIVTDKAGRIVSINKAIEKIFLVYNSEVRERFFLEAIRNNDISELIQDVLKTGKTVATEIQLVIPVRKTFQINATPIFDNDGVNGCLTVIHDITELRRLETMRKDFVANVSHELKTPLTSIKGFVETLLAGALEDKENNRGFLQIIAEHSERLNRLVDDLLSLSRLESKEVALEKETFDLKTLIEHVSASFREQLNKKAIMLSNEVPSGFSVYADKDRMEQVFMNLVDNAIKFNKQGGSIVISGCQAEGGIKITVEDSGIGIPGKDIPRIFERFYRVDKARSRQLGGTGLGLSIVKHAVELHNGSIGVESTEGLGSTFWFILPR